MPDIMALPHTAMQEIHEWSLGESGKTYHVAKSPAEFEDALRVMRRTLVLCDGPWLEQVGQLAANTKNFPHLAHTPVQAISDSARDGRGLNVISIISAMDQRPDPARAVVTGSACED